jgi:acyl-ACP thioesterase
MAISSTYSKLITIPRSAIDANGHVNNVAYVQWMHAESELPSNITPPSEASKLRGKMRPGLSVNIDRISPACI